MTSQAEWYTQMVAYTTGYVVNKAIDYFSHIKPDWQSEIYGFEIDGFIGDLVGELLLKTTKSISPNTKKWLRFLLLINSQVAMPGNHEFWQNHVAGHEQTGLAVHLLIFLLEELRTNKMKLIQDIEQHINYGVYHLESDGYEWHGKHSHYNDAKTQCKALNDAQPTIKHFVEIMIPRLDIQEAYEKLMQDLNEPTPIESRVYFYKHGTETPRPVNNPKFWYVFQALIRDGQLINIAVVSSYDNEESARIVAQSLSDGDTIIEASQKQYEYWLDHERIQD